MLGWTLTIPQLPLGGFEGIAAACVGWILTIPQLPLGGFQAQVLMDKVESNWRHEDSPSCLSLSLI